ncbi:MAG: 2Fe-2S iron-sulfur cluster binding domain-containing protein [Gammaproteobacteria bacterium]|nr:2Fe-2S iron-sulfur cluster binding domain-containing protein [Gammaproteobacteria bacterium]
MKVTDLEGNTHEIQATEGLSIMENIYDAKIPIKAACFGCCSCSTCHVYIDEAWIKETGQPSEEEEDILDMVVDLKENSRLSCQITYNDALDGIHVTLSEDTKTD